MSHALSIAPQQFARRGACPTLDEPMQTGDGLLARLRIKGGRLRPGQLAAIAEAAEQFGNGLLELTARGNLQVRGLSEQTRALFARTVRALAEIEQGLVVETPPLAGDDPLEIADPRRLAAAIRAMAEPFADRLGPKVSVVVDGCGQIGLAQLKADIRLQALGAGHWHISVGGSEAKSRSEDDALEHVRMVLERLAERGPTARASDLVDGVAAKQLRLATPSIGVFELAQGSATGIALPFGSVQAQILSSLCQVAALDGVTEFRLAPQHGLLTVSAGPELVAEAARLGFVTSPADPRLRVSACIGSDGCRSGYIPARQLGETLAPLTKPGEHLHVSGCAKGCAHPRRADITVVGRVDGHGLVFNGTAGDTPRAVLRAEQLESALAAR
jgi:precorrin-3B synthase